MDANGYVNMDIICQFVKLKPSMIRDLVAEGIIKSEKKPNSTQHHFHFLSTIQSLLLHYRERANARTSTKEIQPVDEEIKDLKARELEIKVRKQQTELDILEGRAHTTKDIKLVWGDMISVFRMQMYNIPTICAEKFVGLNRHEAYGLLNTEMKNLAAYLMEYDEAAFMSKAIDLFEEDGDMIEEGEIETSDA